MRWLISRGLHSEDPSATNTHGPKREKGRDGCRVPLPWVAADDPTQGGSFGFRLRTPMRRPICRSLHGFPITLPIEKKRTRHRCLRSIVTPSGCGAKLHGAPTILRGSILTGAPALRMVPRAPRGGVIAYRRDNGWACVTNFGAAPVELPAGRVLLTSSPLADGRLAQDSSAWIMLGEI